MGRSVFDVYDRQSTGVPAELEAIAYDVIGAAIEVHRVLGPGLLESHYQRALSHELKLRDIPHEREAEVEVLYKGIPVGTTKLDFLVAGRLVLELKAVDVINAVHRSQLLTYLKLKHLPLGLLINFNIAILHDGVKRVINTR